LAEEMKITRCGKKEKKKRNVEERRRLDSAA
jgi:hypothetical protein